MSLLKVDQLQTVSGTRYSFGKIINFKHYNTGYGSGSRTTITGSSWAGLNISGTGYTGPRSGTTGSALNVISFPKTRGDTDLLVEIAFPVYLASTFSAGGGIRCQIGLNTVTYNVLDITENGPAERWGAFGYGGNHADILTFTWSTRDNATIGPNVRSHVGNVFLWWQGISWSGDQCFYIDYDNTYPKYGTINVYEVLED
jgi:hypothetical protein